jgi:hypothetical protein
LSSRRCAVVAVVPRLVLLLLVIVVAVKKVGKDLVMMPVGVHVVLRLLVVEYIAPSCTSTAQWSTTTHRRRNHLYGVILKETPFHDSAGSPVHGAGWDANGFDRKLFV